MVTAQGNLHDIHSLETTLVFRGGNEGRLGLSHGKDARLRRINNGGEMVDVKHAEI